MLSVNHTDVAGYRWLRYRKPGFQIWASSSDICYCSIVCPIMYICACIFYHFKINRVILSKRLYGILYCVFPFLLIWMIKRCCNYLDIEVDYRLDDISPLVFLTQNILVITHWLIFKKSYK